MRTLQVQFANWVVTGLFTATVFAQPQTFSSGSTGADGALNISFQGVTYFSPTALSLHPSIPNVFNFTTITIAKGATLKLSEEAFHGPVYFLASGDVDIEGTVDLSGGNAVGGDGNQSDRLPSYAGSGGYGGGLGGGPNGGPPSPEPGNGPYGGAAGTTTSPNGGAGNFSGDQYLIPLIGGSGGGGAFCSQNQFAGTGGAGGGAMLIASSGTITMNGTINASGGNGGGGCALSGGGGGGAIRLVANTLNGSGLIIAAPSNVAQPGQGSPGRIRLEAYQQNFNNTAPSQGPGSIGCPGEPQVGCGYVSQSGPYSLALPATGPSTLIVTAINGISINANPFSFPDVSINTSSPITINVQAKFVPLGAIPNIIISSESGPDQTIACSALVGTLAQSTCSAQVTLPSGGSRGFVKATW